MLSKEKNSQSGEKKRSTNENAQIQNTTKKITTAFMDKGSFSPKKKIRQKKIPKLTENTWNNPRNKIPEVFQKGSDHSVLVIMPTCLGYRKMVDFDNINAILVAMSAWPNFKPLIYLRPYNREALAVFWEQLSNWRKENPTEPLALLNKMNFTTSDEWRKTENWKKAFYETKIFSQSPYKKEKCKALFAGDAKDFNGQMTMENADFKSTLAKDVIKFQVGHEVSEFVCGAHTFVEAADVASFMPVKEAENLEEFYKKNKNLLTSELPVSEIQSVNDILRLNLEDVLSLEPSEEIQKNDLLSAYYSDSSTLEALFESSQYRIILYSGDLTKVMESLTLSTLDGIINRDNSKVFYCKAKYTSVLVNELPESVQSSNSNNLTPTKASQAAFILNAIIYMFEQNVDVELCSQLFQRACEDPEINYYFRDPEHFVKNGYKILNIQNQASKKKLIDAKNGSGNNNGEAMQTFGLHKFSKPASDAVGQAEVPERAPSPTKTNAC